MQTSPAQHPLGFYPPPSQLLVASPAFPPELHALALTGPAALVDAISVNPTLSLDAWRDLYTFRPKVPVHRARLLVSRTLTNDHIEHMLSEKRSSVWMELLKYNDVARRFHVDLARAGKLDSRKRSPRPRWFQHWSPRVPTRLTDESAATTPAQRLGLAEPDPVVHYFLELLGTDRGAWETLLGLVDSFEGTIAELAMTARAL